MLHHEEVEAIVRCEVVQRADMRMVQRRNRTSLALESMSCLRIRCDVDWQYLDRHRPLEPRVARFVHLAHAPGADARRELIRPNPSSFEMRGEGLDDRDGGARRFQETVSTGVRRQ